MPRLYKKSAINLPDLPLILFNDFDNFAMDVSTPFSLSNCQTPQYKHRVRVAERTVHLPLLFLGIATAPPH
jgi:hypothetical protein